MENKEILLSYGRTKWWFIPFCLNDALKYHKKKGYENNLVHRLAVIQFTMRCKCFTLSCCKNVYLLPKTKIL